MKKVLLLTLLIALMVPAVSIAQEVLSAPGGRYVFGQVSEFGKHQYMLDTQTGRLWNLVIGYGERKVLQSVPYLPQFDEELVDDGNTLRSLYPKTFVEAARDYRALQDAINSAPGGSGGDTSR